MTATIDTTRPLDTGLRFDTIPLPDLRIGGKLARWWCKFRADDAHREARRTVGFMAYTGANGSGKTACMVRDTEPDLDGTPWECYNEDHRHNDPVYDADTGDFIEFGPNAQHTGFVRVLSTVKLYDVATGKLHHRYEKLSDWSQLDGLEHAVLLLDEIVSIAHSRDSGSLPHDIQERLMQMRKGDVVVRWSAPHWARADKIIREVTIAITVCEGGVPSRAKGKLWSQNQRFLYRTFDTKDYDEWSAGKAEKVEALAVEHFWGPGSSCFQLYRTGQAVSRLGHADGSGVCVLCGGTRRRPECNCEDYVTRKVSRARSLTPRSRSVVPQ